MLSDSSDILDLLKGDHDSLREILSAIDSTPDLMEKKAFFNELLPILECHVFAQEETLLARSLADPNLKPFAMRGIEEHDVTEFLANKLKRAASDDQWLARLEVLCRFLADQLDKEERDYFPMVESNIGFLERVELADRYTVAREKLKLAPIIQLPIRTSALQSQSGRLGFAVAWLLGVPAWLLLMVFLIGGN